MTKVGRVPSHCASCYQQDSNLRYIDFEAAYDGPVLPGESHKISIDDLVLCERCLEEAFRLFDPVGERREIDRLRSVNDILGKENREKDGMVQRLTETVNALLENPVQRRAGFSAYAALPPDVKKELNRHRKAVKQGKRLEKETRRKRAAMTGEPVDA